MRSINTRLAVSVDDDHERARLEEEQGEFVAG
jgi:hypothetical protein